MVHDSAANDNLTDYHCHLLPDIDDGARHLADSLAMAKLLVAAGYKIVHCTPHCMRGVYDPSPMKVYEAVADLQRELIAEGIELELKPGMEYFLDEFFPEALSNPVPLGDTNYLLVEAPSNADPLMLQENLFLAVRRGFRPLLAHPERAPLLTPSVKKNGLFDKIKSLAIKCPTEKTSTSGNEILDLLRQQGCFFQGNLGSFSGYYGRGIQAKARYFKSIGLYDCYGSDGHRPDALKQYLKQGLACISLSR